MKKSSIAVLLTFGLAAAFNTFAADITVSDAYISVSGTKSPNENVRLNVTDTNGKLIWLDSAEADENGKYELGLKVPFENTSKEYILTVNGTEKQNVVIDGTDEILKKLSSLSEDDFDSYIKAYAERFGLDTEDYFTLKDIKSAYKVFKSFSPKDGAEFKSSFEKTLGICMINESDRGGVFDILKKYSGGIAPKYETDIKNLNQSQLEKFAVELVSEDYYSMSGFESGYSAALEAARNYGKSDSGSGSSGGSGGSKSSGGGKGGFVAPPAASTEPKSDDTKDETNEPFSDLAEADWAKESIMKLYEKGIVKGKENGRFAPNDTVTREEFTAMIVRAFGLKSQNAATFSDIEDGAWYKEAVAAAVENKIVNGISETEFGVSRELTRQDCAAICSRILDYLEVQTENDDAVFADDGEIADYAKDAVYRLKKLGIINGVGENTFSPGTSCTRAMTAKIIDLLGEYSK